MSVDPEQCYIQCIPSAFSACLTSRLIDASTMIYTHFMDGLPWACWLGWSWFYDVTGYLSDFSMAIDVVGSFEWSDESKESQFFGETSVWSSDDILTAPCRVNWFYVVDWIWIDWVFDWCDNVQDHNLYFNWTCFWSPRTGHQFFVFPPAFGRRKGVRANIQEHRTSGRNAATTAITAPIAPRPHWRHLPPMTHGSQQLACAVMGEATTWFVRAPTLSYKGCYQPATQPRCYITYAFWLS